MLNPLSAIVRTPPVLLRNHLREILTGLPLLLVVMANVATASPTPAEEGKAISGMCAGCHGDRGIAVNTRYPNLAGQNYQYLVHALEQFKNGERPNGIMHAMTLDLSKTQIRDLAKYFSSIRSADCKTK